MPIPTNLVTNEIKNSAGTEVEFNHYYQEGRKRVFAQVGEVPNRPHRITVSHTDVGSGAKLRRRSMVRVDKHVTGVDGAVAIPVACCWVDVPIGNLATLDEPKNVLAELMSFLASQGATTTILFDCTGYGAAAITGGNL